MSYNTTTYKDENSCVYYNIQLTNNSTTQIPITYTDYRNQPLFDGHPEDYEMAIVRFQVPCNSLPWRYFPSQSIVAPYVPDNTAWRITLTYLGVDYSAYVIWTGSRSLGIFSIQQLLDYINKAFLDAFLLLQAAHGTFLRCPYMVYDESLGLINLVAPTPDFLSSNVKIYFNTKLYYLFDNFQVNYFGTSGDKNFEFVVANKGNNNINTTAGVGANFNLYGPPPLLYGAGGDAILVKAEFCNLGQIIDVKSVIFTSANLPVSGEFIPNKSYQTSLNTSSGFRNILTDFELSLDGLNAQTVRGIQHFYNQGEYRMIPLSGTTGLKTIDLQASFQTNDLILFPIELAVGAFFSCKLLFRKKGSKSGL
jgi:hypothetical protein